ncbi:hydrogen peroxide-inducible genes activator [Sphingomonas sp. OK281]|uniref:hydrogen peroxide-inducible genes activator n=1 Tax=Sphingomonas sp. OK281 TaxID=1881067 RepID=UPI0008E69D2D|nr:hydrogen peroxide-inducible genes activator [Sphingomonas sp. OK281]SFO10433.1 transcriptional regulator, LysR family [Sphingomonas sp. OK281]
MPNVVSPSLRQLRYLVELRETGHFGRAAAALGVGQSTLSSGIAELERLIGMQLVERTQRSLRFTDVGEAFVVRARSVIDATSALTDFAIASAKPLTGTLRLGIIPTIAPFLLPRSLGAMRAEFPELELHVREMTSERGCADLYRGILDAVILALPYDCGKIDYVEIMQDPLSLATPRQGVSPLLDPQTLLLLEDGHCLNDHGLMGCGLPKARASAMVATSLHTLVELVEAGLGTTFLPQMAIDAGLIDGRQIDTTRLPSRADRTVVLAWRVGSGRENDMRALAQTIRNSLPHCNDR